MQDTALILSGLIIGAIIGLTGVGGGSLMTPLLIMGFGVNPAIAVGTDLLFAAATKLGGTVRLARERLIAWRAVGLLSVGSLPAALLTMAVLKRLGPSSAETEQLIRQVLGVALLL
ncbi:MAG: sulfite exporter TauE/SafE family protein, partial [Burkholderiaceae bacterium]|nr:sulfite exporter TauE/SafE family protein [Burkholderiaceae bacterium]